MEDLRVRAEAHPDEDLRLKTLYHYELLDTAAEPEFDDIVRLAAQVCHTPTALITLVDSDRQWFKARLNFDREQTDLDCSIAAHAILTKGLLEIPDLCEDRRTCDMPVVAGPPHFRFYAGAPLLAPNGMPLGTLSVLDMRPRRLSDDQRDALMILSRQIAAQFELRVQLSTEKKLRGEMDHRVRNSLQTLSSVLQLSSAAVRDEEAREVLGIAQRRLQSVASLHSELMGQAGRPTVSTAPYLRRLRRLLQDAAPDNVQIEVKAENVQLEGRRASALGMIVSEFVANAIKHAFPDGSPGRVTLTLDHTDNGDLRLVCRDNGIGQPVKLDIDPENLTDRLGKRLIDAAIIQLEGEVEQLPVQHGTALDIRFHHP